MGPNHRKPHDIYSSIGIPVIIISPGYDVVSINRIASEALGMSNGEADGKKCYEIFHKSKSPPAECPLKKTLETHKPESSRMVVETLDGTYLVTCFPEFDEPGNLLRIVHTLIDISDIKKAESQATRAMEESKKRERELQLLFDGARVVLKQETFRTTARSIFDACCDTIGATSGYVALLSEDGSDNEVLFLESGGRSCSVDTSLPMPIRGLRGEAYRLHRVVYDNDFKNSGWMDFIPPGHVDLNNVMFAPLNHDGNTVGLIGVANKPTDFTEDDARLASAFADLAAISLINSRSLDQLTHQRDKAQQYLDLAGVMFVALDTEGRVTMANRKACDILGFDEHKILGENWFDNFIPEPERNRVRDVFRKLLQGDVESVEYFENNVLTKSGDKRLIAWHNDVLRNERGGINGILGSGTDITDYVALENAKVEAMQKYRNLFDASNEGLLILDGDMRIVEANDTAAEMFGFSKDELAGMPLPGISAEKAQTNIAVAKLRTEGAVQVDRRRQRRKDGSTFISQIYGKQFSVDKQTYYMYQIRDVTDHVIAEEKLSGSRTLIDLTGRMAKVGGWEVDAETLEVTWTQEACRIHGLPTGQKMQLDEAIGLFHPDDRGKFKTALRNALINGEPYDLELRFLTANGKKAWTHTICKPIPAAGKIVKLIGSFQDITDRKQAEKKNRKLTEQLLQSQKMEAIGRLAGGIAHDFNNLLTVIMGNANLMEMKLDESDPNYMEVSSILDASERAKALTMKLLTFSRKDKLNIKRVLLDDIISGMVELLERSMLKNINIVKILQSKVWIRVDTNQINQALLNICNNAADAMPEGGTLTIETQTVSLNSEHCRTCGKRFDGLYCLLQISDTGVGIPPEILNKVTEPFFTTKEIGKGTGLGLSITHGIVENHNGHLHIYSEVGKGTCVKIYLPFVMGEYKPAATASQDAVLTGSETVLIVDDEQSVRSVAERLFRLLGYNPILAESGITAVELFREQSEKIDIVVLDLVMPGMDGMATFRLLKEIDPEVKVLVSSGYSINGQAGDVLEMGALGFIQKPFFIENLVGAIRNILDADVM